MEPSYAVVQVTEDENENGIELSLENDMSLKEETVSSKFPEYCALAYKSGNSNKWKALEKKNQKFLPPQGGWGATRYVCVRGRKNKYKLTNFVTGLTKKKVQEYLESYGIVEIQKFDNINKIAYVIVRFITDALLENMKTQQHPFTIEEVTQTDREKFTKRSGTTNMGHEFENMTMASLLLNLTVDGNVKDFRMSSNDEDFGSFDDIVVDIQLTNGDVRKYAIQLKYKNDPKQPLKKYLTSVNGDFSIQKYFKDFTDMIEYTKSYNLILFTNLEFSEKLNSLKLDNTNFTLQIGKENIPDEFGKGFGYNFFSNESEISNQHKMFFDKFLLYPNQPTVKEIERNICEKFNVVFSFKNIANYLKSISEWNNNPKKNKNKINKTFMRELLALQILNASIKSFPTVKKENNVNIELFKKATFGFTVTVVDKKYSEHIKKIWENETMNVSEIERVLTDFHLKNLSDDEKRVVALWIMNKCPLIIKESEMAYRVISLCREKRFVLLKKDTPVPNDLKVFMKLTDLDPNSDVYKNITKSFYCLIKSKQTISLEDLINQYTHFENFVTTNELIQMLDGPLNIGQQETDLDVYIDRLVTRLTIDFKFFDNVDKDTLVIISCQGRENILKDRLKNFNLIDTEDYLNQKAKTMQIETFNSQIKDLGNIKEKTAYFSKHQITQETFNIICKRNPSRKKCHHFRIIESEVLEWMYSKGGISDLQRYKTNSSFLKETDLFNNKDAINILTADPGMGKTELMKKFYNMCPSSSWTILIVVNNNWSEHLKGEEKKDNFFKIVVKNFCKTKFEVDMLKVMRNTGRITFLWDGLDELSSTQVDTVIELIDDLVKEGFKQWISCRKHLEEKLEKKFNVLSRSIKQFDKEEQKNYICRRFNSPKKQINTEEVVHKIHDYINTVQYNEILGIPLQIFILTELLLKDPKLLHTLLNEVFPITDLYKYFIEMKFELYFVEKNKLKEENTLLQLMKTHFQEEQLIHHQKAALLITLEDQFIDKLDISTNSAILNEEVVYGIGIITGKTDSGNAKFLHFSYAEYFVAVYLYQNRNKYAMSIKEYIFQENYRNIRFMFDLLLAKNCPAHLAVLYNNFDYLKSCDNYTCKDEIGRNPLQIACAWGPRFPLLRTVQQGDYFLIDDEQASLVDLSSKRCYDEMLNLLLDHNNALDKDLFFHFNSIEYADLSLSLKPLAMFLRKKYHFTFNTLKNFNDIFTLFYYSIKFNYNSILCNFENIPVLKPIKYCNTMLHLASVNNSLDCIKVLLRDKNYRSKINAENQYCQTPIYFATHKGNYEIVKYLAESGADVNIQNQDGWVPLHVAAFNGHIELVKLLVNDLKANVNAKNVEGCSPIYNAVRNGHYEVVKYLAESGADVNIQARNGWIPIHTAVLHGHIEVIKLLVNDLKANVNASDNEGLTPISIATGKGHYEIVKYLAESGADVNVQNQDGWAPIHIAAQNGHIEVIKYLAESGAEINIQNQNGDVPIHLAVFFGRIDVVKLLVDDMKANVNAKNNEGFAPIYFAAGEGHYDVVKYLAESGADVNIQNQNDSVPIHVAAHNGHIEVVKLLVNDLKANVTATDKGGFTPIILAAGEGHYEVVKYLADSGADVNIQNEDGWLPIHAAAFNGHSEVVKLLVNDLKANVNAKNNRGFTPIYNAAENNHYEVVKYLAESGAGVNIPNQDGYIPIHVAAENGHIEVVKLLVNDLKANVNAKNVEGVTPIYLAAENGHCELLKYLAESEADVNIENQIGWVPIHVAASNGHIEVVKLLVNDLKINVNATDNEGFTPIYLAAQNGHYEVAKYLADSGADVNIQNQNGWIPIQIAAKNGHIEVVKLFVNDLKNNVNAKSTFGFTPIYVAAENGHYEVVKYLAESGADVNIHNQDGWVPLHVAACNGHIESVKLLVNDLKANVNTKNNEGFTPIYAAAKNGHYEVVKYLAESGADVNIQDQSGWVPIHITAQNGHIEIIKYLVESGADVNIHDKDSDVPIHIAAFHGQMEVVKLLVNELKANVNAKNNEGITPIHNATQNGHYDVVKYLAESGADVNMQNQSGDIPIHIAAKNGHTEVVKLLINLKSNLNAKNKKSLTPVDLAAENGHYEVVQELKKSERLKEGIQFEIY